MKEYFSNEKTDEWIIRIATLSGYLLSFLLGILYFTDLIENSVTH